MRKTKLWQNLVEIDIESSLENIKKTWLNHWCYGQNRLQQQLNYYR